MPVDCTYLPISCTYPKIKLARSLQRICTLTAVTYISRQSPREQSRQGKTRNIRRHAATDGGNIPASARDARYCKIYTPHATICCSPGDFDTRADQYETYRIVIIPRGAALWQHNGAECPRGERNHTRAAHAQGARSALAARRQGTGKRCAGNVHVAHA